jgi:hypothetical protein
LRRQHARAQVVVDVQLEMALHFIGKFALARFSSEQPRESKQQSAQPSHL